MLEDGACIFGLDIFEAEHFGNHLVREDRGGVAAGEGGDGIIFSALFFDDFLKFSLAIDGEAIGVEGGEEGGIEFIGGDFDFAVFGADDGYFPADIFREDEGSTSGVRDGLDEFVNIDFVEINIKAGLFSNFLTAKGGGGGRRGWGGAARGQVGPWWGGLGYTVGGRGGRGGIALSLYSPAHGANAFPFGGGCWGIFGYRRGGGLGGSGGGGIFGFGLSVCTVGGEQEEEEGEGGELSHGARML